MGTSNIKRVEIDYSYDPKAPVDLGLNSPPPEKIQDISYYTPEGKIYFGSDTGTEIIDPAIFFATSAMGGLSFTEGIASYLGNNFIALASFFLAGDQAMGLIDTLGENWGSLFQNDGILSDLNDFSYIKYNDNSWNISSSLGHAVTVGGVRYLCSFIPDIGVALGNIFTFGDGFGSTYRLARESGKDIITSNLYGITNGFVQQFSFAFSGMAPNVTIGFLMPFFEAYIQAMNDNSEGSFIEKFNKNFEEAGGLAYLFVSTTMYGLNADASIKMNDIRNTTNVVISDIDDAVKDFNNLKGVYKFFDTPFITTALNNALTAFFSSLNFVFTTSDVTSVRPI